ncbi:MAG TPA: nitroreductase family protein [Candidatus Binatia bacterium]|nr:nitroreductase family protein [Candidatus Binatia bacterium]
MPEENPIGLFEAIYTARALRRFKPDPVPDEVLFQLFDAAIRAPSGQNAQDWRFVIITEPAIKRHMQEWAKEGWARYQPRYAENPTLMDQLPRTQRLALKGVAHLAHHLAEVPVIVVVCGLRGRHATPGGSIFPAVQNLLLAARALGLGGSIFNLPLTHTDELMAAVGIPESNQIYCLIPLGYPLDKPGPVRRKPVKQVVFWHRWQQRWPFAEEQPDEGWQARWIGGSDKTSAST